MPKRKIIVNIATSADGYVARLDGNLDWLTKRPAPKGFYGLPAFSRSVDAKILGRKTFDVSLKLGARFSASDVHYVFSRQPPPVSIPAGVQFVSEPIRNFANRLCRQISVLTTCSCAWPSPTIFLQFFVDNAVPSIGPTNPKGDFLVAKGVSTQQPHEPSLPDTQSYPASVIATVTNTNSSDHTIAVNLGCEGDLGLNNDGCWAIAHAFTMRVDVFTP